MACFIQSKRHGQRILPPHQSFFQSSYFKHRFNYYSWPVFFQQWLCNIYILLLPLYSVSVIVAGGVRLSSASFRLSTHAQATMHNTTECTRSCWLCSLVFVKLDTVNPVRPRFVTVYCKWTHKLLLFCWISAHRRSHYFEQKSGTFIKAHFPSHK